MLSPLRTSLRTVAWRSRRFDPLAAGLNAAFARLQATDGNLSVHLRKLEDAGYVAIAAPAALSGAEITGVHGAPG
jgi:hypothetical protein